MAAGIRREDLKKAVFYLKRNGIKNTCYAIWERLAARRQPLYRFIPPDEKELDRQRAICREYQPVCKISIVVPCYRTDPVYLKEMIESVTCQTYRSWELILADATEDDSVEKVVRTVKDQRIRYIRLGENRGIAENTNRGIECADGDYVGFLDHDDLLAPDALFEVAEAVRRGKETGCEPVLIYSDEDKYDDAGKQYFEPHYKEDFNLDLLLSNNYICHFMVIKREVLGKLPLRKEYEGAQDYDLVLRASAFLAGNEDAAVHLNQVLYHWRCHGGSTAANPQSKLYAYDAGRRAVQNFSESMGWKVTVRDTQHLGFYRIDYPDDIFKIRKDVGAVGGPVIKKGRICGGRLGEDGKVFYEGLKRRFGGYFHRALLQQDALALDIRNIRIRDEVKELFCGAVGVPWKTVEGEGIFDVSALPDNTDYREAGIAFGQALKKAGYRLLYLPENERIL